MGEITKVTEQGFFLHEQPWKLNDLALVSLKIGLKAYFSTYQSMKFSLHIFDNEHNNESIDSNHWTEYCVACAETIVHFQHFAELIIKDLLRKKYELLVLDASKDHDLFYRLLQGEEIKPVDYEKLKTVEFSLALERICELIKKGRLDKEQFDFILQAKEMLVQLNYLRNRLWHRGSFILRYDALDQFVGKWILPFIQKVVSLPDYKDKEGFWKYGTLTCRIDPIVEIIDHLNASNTYNIGKIAFVKELGRASFENPLATGHFAFLDNLTQHRAENMAAIEVEGPNGYRVTACPVCGSKSLIVFDDVEMDGLNQDGTYERAWRYTWEVKCLCCSFTINHHLENPSNYGYDFIEDYWEGEEL